MGGGGTNPHHNSVLCRPSFILVGQMQIGHVRTLGVGQASNGNIIKRRGSTACRLDVYVGQDISRTSHVHTQ
eukprot:scaffold238068_cov48-Attheya_sp.AAC.1